MRLYLDTSVFGGYYDEEFAQWTKPLFELIFKGVEIAVISDLTILELQGAPQHVKELMNRVMKCDSEVNYRNRRN